MAINSPLEKGRAKGAGGCPTGPEGQEKSVVRFENMMQPK